MANKTPWSERSGSQRRRTFGTFALVYGAIAVIALAFGWFLIGAVFGLGAAALGIAWSTTEPTEAPAVAERPKPAWMLAMDDPNAPDLSLPEYRTKPVTADDTPAPPVPTPDAPPPPPATARSPFDRPDGVPGVTVDPDRPVPPPPPPEPQPPATPPSPGA